MNNFINIFSRSHKYFSYRWLILSIVGSAALMFYFDYYNDGLFMQSSQGQQWNSRGPGYHK